MLNKTSGPNHASIDTHATGATISPYLYGHFAEHLGRGIYDGFWVGPGSSEPNTRGLRSQIIAALRNLQIPVLRWPGGCFADEYHWQDGVGPAANRRPMVNTHWGGGVESNHFGTHEFLDLCEQLGCAPYISANVGSGSVREMQDWVEYMTFDGPSPLADQRRANGREAPWRVRFWGVGNENWGCGGNMRPEFYADQYRRYATYCRNFEPNRLYKIACGANAAEYNWTEVLMREAGRLMDGLSLHYYTVAGSWEAKGSATQFGEPEWFGTLKKALFIDELIRRHAQIMDRFDPRRRVGLIVDEWGSWHDVEPGTPPRYLYQQNTLRDALVAGATLNIFNQHCDRVHMANLAQTVNVLQALILTEGDQIVLTPTYHVFKMYQVHQGATWLPVTLACQAYVHNGEAIPALSLSASRGRDGQIHLSVCNLDPRRDLGLAFELPGVRPTRASACVLTAAAINAHNTAQQPAAVQPAAFTGFELKDDSVWLDLPAKSVVVLELDGPD